MINLSKRKEIDFIIVTIFVLIQICHLLVVLSTCGIQLWIFSVQYRPLFLIICLILSVVSILRSNIKFDYCFLSFLIFFAYIMIRIFASGGNVTNVLIASIWIPILLGASRTLSQKNETYKYIFSISAMFNIIFSFIYILILTNVLQSTANTAFKVNFIYYSIVLLPFSIFSNRKILRITSIFLTLLSVFISIKLGAAIIVFSIITICALFKGESKLKNGLIFFFVGIILVLIVVILENTINLSLVEKFLNIDESGGSGRYEIFYNSLSFFSNFSFSQKVFGAGYDASFSLMGINCHNDFIETLFDYGIFGLLLLLISFGILIKKIFSFGLTRKNKSIALSCILCFLILMSLSNFIYIESYILTMSFMIGYCSSMQLKGDSIILYKKYVDPNYKIYSCLEGK